MLCSPQPPRRRPKGLEKHLRAFSLVEVLLAMMVFTLMTQYGFSSAMYYDGRLADNPPPFFPTTGTQYDVLSWQRPGGLLP